MRILVYGINYASELTGIGKYTAEMCEWFAANGDYTTVITANPYYPEWKIHKGYKNKYSTEVLKGVNIHRVPIYIPKKVNGAKRILHDFSFLFSSLLIWLRLIFAKKYDLIFCIAPPFHIGLWPILYRVFRGGEIVYHIQDLQVDAAADLGMIKNKVLIKLLFKAEKLILKASNKVTTISLGMQKKINTKANDLCEILLPNWADTEFLKPLDNREALKERYGFSQNDFVILYSGNLGEKQGLDIILDAAKGFASDSHVKFVISGNGAYKNKLIDLKEKFNLRNVSFFPLQPYGEFPLFLNMADLHLIVQKKAAGDLVLPSKLTNIAAVGGVSIVTAEKGTSLHAIVNDHNLGITIEPESTEALVNAIRKALGSDLNDYRRSARTYSELNLNKDSILSSFRKRMEPVE